MSRAAVAVPVVALLVGAIALACGAAGTEAPEDLPLPPRGQIPDPADGSTDDGRAPSGESPDAGGSPLDAGDGGARPGCQGALDCERVVFVTRATMVGGELGGLAGADRRCQDAADAADAHLRIRRRIFQAWLGGGAVPVVDRFVHGTKPYVLATGTVIVASWSKLVAGTLTHGIDQDETGATSSGVVWTGVNGDGSSSSATCGDWTNAQAKGQRGNIGGTGGGWTDRDTAGCANSHPIYCFEL